MTSKHANLTLKDLYVEVYALYCNALMLFFLKFLIMSFCVYKNDLLVCVYNVFQITYCYCIFCCLGEDDNFSQDNLFLINLNPFCLPVHIFFFYKIRSDSKRQTFTFKTIL